MQNRFNYFIGNAKSRLARKIKQRPMGNFKKQTIRFKTAALPISRLNRKVANSNKQIIPFEKLTFWAHKS